MTNPYDTHDWTQDTLEPVCQSCGCRLIVPYGGLTDQGGTPCPGSCLPLIDSPPLVPAAPFQPTRAQIRFMRLHAWHLVEKWQWHWFQTLLRATTDRGVTASLWVDDVEALIREGLMEAGMGCTMEVTDAGRELVDEWRNA